VADNKFEKCVSDDPLRCQASDKNGQCIYKAVAKDDGTGYFKYCPRHNHHAAKMYEDQKIRNYRLNRYQHRINEFADNNEVKSLREEVGISRLLLETIWNQCHSETELILKSNKIQSLVNDIDKLVNSCHKLEISTGQLMDQETLKRVSNAIIEIVASETDAETSGRIGDKIISTIVEIVNET
jgi:hypothetical protein